MDDPVTKDKSLESWIWDAACSIRANYAPVKLFGQEYVPETWAMANMNMIIHERAEYGRQIIATLSQQLSWSHFMELLPLEQPLRRDFYAEMCRVERWTVRTLRDRIDSMLFERTAISKKPEELAKAEIAALRAEDQISPSMVFKDPYLLDFLGLNDRYLEKDLEDAILLEIETFLLELGNGFAFLGRQSWTGFRKKRLRGLHPTRRFRPHNQIFDRVEGKHSRIVDDNGKYT